MPALCILSMLLPASGCTGGGEPEDRPVGRYSAVGAMGPDGRYLYVAGGGTASAVRSDAWRLDVDAGAWERLGDMPAPMLRGTAVLLDRTIWVFGGEDGSYADIDRLWAWDLDADTWTEHTQPGPSVRKKHAAVGIGDTMLVHGGQHNDVDPDIILGDLWSWDPATTTWTELSPDDAPLGAWRQALAFDADSNTVWMQGGYDQTDTRTDWLWSLDLTGQAWQQHPSDGAWPPVRASHSMVAFPGSVRGGSGTWLGLWGGTASDTSAWVFDPAAAAWTELPAADGPLRRDAQVTGLSADGGTMVLACGDPVSDDVPDFVCDAWALDLSTGTWTELVPIAQD